MRKKGRSLGIEDKFKKFGVDDPEQRGSSFLRDDETHKYYCPECLSELPFLKDCRNCGRKIDWSSLDMATNPASPPNPRFKPRRYI